MQEVDAIAVMHCSEQVGPFLEVKLFPHLKRVKSCSVHSKCIQEIFICQVLLEKKIDLTKTK